MQLRLPTAMETSAIAIPFAASVKSVVAAQAIIHTVDYRGTIGPSAAVAKDGEKRLPSPKASSAG